MLYFIPGISFFPLDIIFLLDFYIILEEYVLSVSKFIGIKLFWGEGGLLFIYDNYPTAVILSSQKFFEMIPWALANQRMESSDSPILQMGPQRAQVSDIEPAYHLVNLSHIHLDGCVALGANDAVAGGAFPGQVQVQELMGIILHVTRVHLLPLTQKRGIKLFIAFACDILKFPLKFF